MRVEKRLNNNVVLATKDNQQIIVMGKGVGFGKHPGDQLENNQIEKIFYPENGSNVHHLVSLVLGATPLDIEIVESAITYGSQLIQAKLNPNIFFTLLDHICFSLKRYESRLDIVNPLDWEIKKFYPIEYGIGKFTVELIRDKLAVQIVDQEASFIALHFVNAQMDSGATPDTIEHIELVNEILQLVKYHLQIDFDKDSYYFQRFLTHLRYYLMRQKSGKIIEDDQSELVQMVFERFTKEKACVDLIVKYLKDKKRWHTSEIEQMYLVLHIRNLIEKKDRKS